MTYFLWAVQRDDWDEQSYAYPEDVDMLNLMVSPLAELRKIRFEEFNYHQYGVLLSTEDPPFGVEGEVQLDACVRSRLSMDYSCIIDGYLGSPGCRADVVDSTGVVKYNIIKAYSREGEAWMSLFGIDQRLLDRWIREGWADS